jgi:hypothetical protein
MNVTAVSSMSALQNGIVKRLMKNKFLHYDFEQSEIIQCKLFTVK